MNKILTLLLLVAVIYGLDPTLKNALRNQVLIDFKNAIVPIIAAQVRHMDLPDIKTHNSGFDIEVSGIHIDVNDFGPGQINIQFIAGTPTLLFSGAGFGMQGRAHISAKSKLLKKSTDATITVSEASFNLKIRFVSVNGKPNIIVEQINLGLSASHVSIKLHGGLIDKIINFIIDLMKGHIVSHVVAALNQKVPPVVTAQINAILNTLPSDIPIGATNSIRYSFPYAPNVFTDYLFTGILAYVHPNNDPNPPPYPIKGMPDYNPGIPRGIQFFFSDYIIKSFLDAGFRQNQMVIEMNKDILGHRIQMVCVPSAVPQFDFRNAIVAEVQALCDVILDGKPEDKFGLKFTEYSELSEYINAAVLFFNVVKTEFRSIEYITTKPIDIDWFKNGINTVLAALAEIVNGEIGRKGIPLPTIQQVTYADLVQYVRDGYLEIGATPQFHFTGLPEETEL